MTVITAIVLLTAANLATTRATCVQHHSTEWCDGYIMTMEANYERRDVQQSALPEALARKSDGPARRPPFLQHGMLEDLVPRTAPLARYARPFPTPARDYPVAFDAPLKGTAARLV